MSHLILQEPPGIRSRKIQGVMRYFRFFTVIILIALKGSALSVTEEAYNKLQNQLKESLNQEIQTTKNDTTLKYHCKRQGFGIRCSKEGEKLPFNPKDEKIKLPVGWIVIDENLNSEKVSAAFPAFPKIWSVERGVIHESVDRKQVYYILDVSEMIRKPETNTDEPAKVDPSITYDTEELVFEHFLNIYSSAQMKLNLFQIGSWKGYPTLDIESTSANGLITKARILITDRNIYWFSTVYEEGTEEKHDLFINSFRIKR